MYYQTQLIGDAKTLPTLLAAPSFSGIGLIGMKMLVNINLQDLDSVIDVDPYLAGGAQWYTNQNNLYVALILLHTCFLYSLFSFRSVRNFVIDLRQVAGGATGIHWQVSQATSLINLVFQMSTAAGNQHQGEPY